MKKCLICEKEVEENEELCSGCLTFFKWKYGKKFKIKIKNLVKNLSNSIKFRRAK